MFVSPASRDSRRSGQTHWAGCLVLAGTCGPRLPVSRDHSPTTVGGVPFVLRIWETLQTDWRIVACGRLLSGEKA